jgi:hypothetical protein
MGRLSNANSALIKAKRIVEDHSRKTELSKECLEVANSIGRLVYRINQIWLKERDLSYENRYTAEQLQRFFDQGYAIQRKFKGNARGWGTLRSRPTFDNNELARYAYRVMELKRPELKKVYEEVRPE